jgi:hypothetical protein
MRVLLGVALLLAACGGAPGGPPSITGLVTRVSGLPGANVVLLVEELPTEQTGNKMSLTIDGSTRLYRQTDTGTVGATIDEVRGAVRVSAWVNGPVLMSYPSQGKADAVLILTPR